MRIATPAWHDTLIFHRDSTVILSRTPPSPDSGAAAPPAAKRYPPPGLTGFDQPKWVMLRSLAVPGWGQLHNGSWKKAVVIGGGEVALITKLIVEKRDLDREKHVADDAALAGDPDLALALEDAYNQHVDRYIGHQWWLGALLAYSLVDAYIDAHFRNFRVGPNDDPALPPVERRSAGLRLSWQEHF